MPGCRCRRGYRPTIRCPSGCRSWRRRWPTTGCTASAPPTKPRAARCRLPSSAERTLVVRKPRVRVQTTVRSALDGRRGREEQDKQGGREEQDKQGGREEQDKQRGREEQDRQMRIGILTGGGDCPGLNAVIRAVVRTCDSRYG